MKLHFSPTCVLLGCVLVLCGHSFAQAIALPMPPEFDAAKSLGMQVAQAQGVSADAKVRVRNELRNLESSFQSVWQPLQQAYDQVLNKRAEFERIANGLAQEVQAHNDKPHVFTLPDQQYLLDDYDAEAAALRQRQTDLDGRAASELQPLINNMQSQAERAQSWLDGPTLTNFESMCRRALSMQQDGPAMRQLKQADQQGRTYRNTPDRQASDQLRTPFDTSGGNGGVRVSDSPADVVDLRGVDTRKPVDLRTIRSKSQGKK